MKKLFIAFLTPLYFYITAVNAANLPKHKITLEQAKMLVMTALTPEQRRAPGVEIDRPDHETLSWHLDSYKPRFANFYVVWASLPESSVTLGHFAVDIYTGDVFDGVSMTCDGIENAKLRIFQKQVRRLLHLTDTEYQKIKTHGPECVE
jgi:hypothetical protein